MAQAYELSCLGQLPANEPELLEALQNRLQQQFHLVETFEQHEYLFVKDEVYRLEQQGTRDEDFLRLRRTSTGSTKDAAWHLHSLSEAIRSHESALCRAYTDVTLINASQEQSRRFASALGFKPKSDLIRKGLHYSRGSATVSIFQLYHVDAPETALLPLVYLVEAVNRVFVPSSAPAPKGNSKQMDSSAAVKNPSAQSHQVIAQGLEVVEDIKSMLKGLVALQKVDPAF